MGERPEETMLRAAKQIRWEQESGIGDQDRAMIPVAEWLEATAHDIKHVHDPIYVLTSTTINRATKAAKAILGEE